MAKRIYEQSIIKWLLGYKKSIAGVGIAGATFIGWLFFYLAVTGAISDYTYSGDSLCTATSWDDDPSTWCYAYINFTAEEDIFLYPTGYDPWGRNTTFVFEPNIKEWKLQRSWGKGFRTIPLNESCTGTWCGLSNSKDSRKFSIVFREGRSYQIRVAAIKYNGWDDIKWSAFDGMIDPVWFGDKKTHPTYKENFTSQTRTECFMGQCNTQFYDVTKFVEEGKGNWVDRNNAKSLKGKIPLIIENDPNFRMTIQDYNMTSISVCLGTHAGLLDTNLPIKIINTHNKSRIYKTYNLKLFSASTDSCFTYPFSMEKELHFGWNSTVTRFNSSAGDGRIWNGGTSSWTETRDGTEGTITPSPTGTFMRVGAEGSLFISRTWLVFDTGSTISAGATINNATVHVYVTSKFNSAADGYDYVSIVQTNQSNSSTLVSADYTNIALIQGGPQETVPSISTTAYNTWTLNATGLAWIKTSGDASNCGTISGITCLGMREGHDLDDVDPGALGARLKEMHSSENTNPPFLNVTWTEAAAPGESVNISFVDPTPTNNTSSINNSYIINTSIDVADLGTVIYNWNGTNYTVFDNDTEIMWNFDNVSALGETNTHIFDVSGNGHNLTLLNGASLATGKYGKAIQFFANGTEANATGTSFGENSEMTISMWLNITGQGGGGSGGWWLGWIAHEINGTTTDRDWQIFQRNQTLDMTFWNSSGSTASMKTGNITYNEWFHFVVTINSSGDLRLYLDGVLTNSTNLPGGIQDLSSQIFLGDSAWTSGFYYNGLIDELTITNKSSTHAEINRSYMNNLYKYDVGKWALRVNQIQSPGVGLVAGTYTYQSHVTSINGTANQTEVRTLTVLPSPTVTLNTPLNSSFSISTNQTFNYTPNTPNNILNATVYSNFSGSWQANESNTTGITNGVANFINVSGLTTGNYVWNVRVCDDIGNCRFADDNFSLEIQTALIVSFVDPTVVNTTLIYGQSIFNVTTDRDIASCNLTFDGTNYGMTQATNQSYNVRVSGIEEKRSYYNATCIEDGNSTTSVTNYIDRGSIIAKDRFYNSDGTALDDATHFGAYNADWTKTPYSVSDDVEIWDNMISQFRVVGGETSYYSSHNPLTADYNIEADFIILDTTDDAHGLVGRLNITNQSYYLFGYRTGSDNLFLNVFKNGASEQIDNITPGWGAGENYTLKLVLNGTSIQGYVDDVLTLNATDDNVTSPGKAGVRLVGVVPHTNGTGLWLDNFHVFNETNPITYSESGIANPIFIPANGTSDADNASVRDSFFITTNGIRNIIYTGIPTSPGGAATGIGRIMYATSENHTGVYTRQGHLLLNKRFLKDTFQESNGTNLVNHSPENGLRENWIKISGDNLTIQGNAAIIDTDSVGEALYYLKDFSCAQKPEERGFLSGEYDVRANYTRKAGTTNGGVTARMSTNGSNYYSAEYNSTSGDWELMKSDAGIRTKLGSYTQSLTENQTYTVKLSIEDTQKLVYVDDVLRINSSNNDINETGKPGIRGSGVGMTYAGFEAYNIGEEQGADPWLIHDGNNTWHMYYSSNIFHCSGSTYEYGKIAVGYRTATGNANSIPNDADSWHLISSVFLIGSVDKGWTKGGADGLNISGIAAPKVIAHDNGGYIMYLANWGEGLTNATEGYKTGYANATALGAEFTLQDELMGISGDYQSEQATPMKYAGLHYLFINRVGEHGRGGTNWPDLFIDVWRSSSQTEGFELLEADIVNRGDSAWSAETTGVAAFAEHEFTGDIEGIYDGSTVVGAPLDRNIGALVLSVGFTTNLTNNQTDFNGTNLYWDDYNDAFSNYTITRSTSTPVTRSDTINTTLVSNYHDESAASGITYYYAVFIIDSSNNTLFKTNELEVTTLSLDTCTYGGSGNWDIDASDNCVLSIDTSLPANDIICTGTGGFTVNATIDVRNRIINAPCWYQIINGGFN